MKNPPPKKNNIAAKPALQPSITFGEKNGSFLGPELEKWHIHTFVPSPLCLPSQGDKDLVLQVRLLTGDCCKFSGMTLKYVKIPLAKVGIHMRRRRKQRARQKKKILELPGQRKLPNKPKFD